MTVKSLRPNAIVFDAFDALVNYGGARLNRYRRVLDGRIGKKAFGMQARLLDRRAGQSLLDALEGAMTRDNLIAVVPMREFRGRPFYVRIV